MTSTWLMFLYLGIAAFAPVLAHLRPGPWMAYYYGALLVWWILVSVAAVRRHGRDEAERRRNRTAPPAREMAPAEDRLIIVARDDATIYDRLRRDQLGDETVRVIPNRRSADRRRQLEVYIPDRRRGDRRRADIDPLLLTQGWAEVTSLKSYTLHVR